MPGPGRLGASREVVEPLGGGERAMTEQTAHVRTCSEAGRADTSHHDGNVAGHGNRSAGEGADQAVTAVEPAPSGNTWSRPLALVDGHPVSVGDIRARPPRRRAAGLPVTGGGPLCCIRDRNVLKSVIQPPHERLSFLRRLCHAYRSRSVSASCRPRPPAQRIFAPGSSPGKNPDRPS